MHLFCLSESSRRVGIPVAHSKMGNCLNIVALIIDTPMSSAIFRNSLDFPCKIMKVHEYFFNAMYISTSENKNLSFKIEV